MGMTMAEKILARAGGLPEVKPGDVAVVDVETAVLMDMTFLPEGWREVLKVKDPKKVAVIFDHLVPAPTLRRRPRTAPAGSSRANSASSGCMTWGPTGHRAWPWSPTRATRCPAPCW